ncbi:MAG: hypothetical protein ABWJ97_04695 [Thermoproteus sp.]
MKAYLALWVFLTGAVYAYLAALGVGDMGVYVSLLALTYFVALALARPVAPHYRRAADVVAAALFVAFLYFAAMRITALLT